MSTVTVISTNFNHAQFLRATVESVLGQSYRDIQYIVVDGGSSDASLKILAEYPSIEVITGPDEGPFHAFHKALAVARGEYIMQCAVTDGYLDMTWIAQCVAVLDRDPEVSLVWGLPQYMSESGDLLDVSFPQFHEKDPPQKENFFYYWLGSFFYFPEGNYCIRKSVFQECYRAYDKREYLDNGRPRFDPWLELNFWFNRKGYLPFFIRSIASFGRVHGDQRGQQEVGNGVTNTIYNSYIALSRDYRTRLLMGSETHRWRSGSGVLLGIVFSHLRLLREFVSVHFLINALKPLVRPMIKRFESSRALRFLLKSAKKFS